MSRSDHIGKEGPSLRLLRVGENIRHAISAILSRGDIQDAVLQANSVTVSEVRVSPDLRNATVFFMSLGGKNVDPVKDALTKHSAYIRGQMSKKLHMKYMPKLKFKLDESFDEASHIDTLLRDPKVTRDLTADDSREEGSDD